MVKDIIKFNLIHTYILIACLELWNNAWATLIEPMSCKVETPNNMLYVSNTRRCQSGNNQYINISNSKNDAASL